jgi:hypothetical protein
MTNKQKTLLIASLALLLAAAVCGQQTKAQTTFNGFYIGETKAEFAATEKGAAILAKYAEGCRPGADYLIRGDCHTYQDFKEDWIFTLSDPIHPHFPEDPDTIYHFQNGKLDQIVYNPTCGGAACFNQQVRFLSEKYGKPTSSSLVTEQNGFGARLTFKVVQWHRPDGTTIQAKAGTFLDATTQVIFEKPISTKAASNPY